MQLLLPSPYIQSVLAKTMHTIVKFCLIAFGALVLVVSGLIVNLIQAANYLLIRPASRRLFRRINVIVEPLFLLVQLFILESWAGIKVELYTDRQTYDMIGKESAIIISNHKHEIDWLFKWIIAERKGLLGRTMGVSKNDVLKIPLLGSSLCFSGTIFLHQSWAKDESKMKASFKSLKDEDQPFWLVIYLEGGRLTPGRLRAAQEFAISRGFQVPKNVMIPRTKGFSCALNNMRSFVPAIYDATLVVSKNWTEPFTLGVIQGKPSLVNIQLKRYSTEDLPESDDGIAEWCRDRFVAKDALIENFQKDRKLEGHPCGDSSPSKRAINVFAAWSCFVTLAIIKLYQTFPVLSSWKALVIVSVTLAFVLYSLVVHARPLPSNSEISAPENVGGDNAAMERLTSTSTTPTT